MNRGKIVAMVLFGYLALSFAQSPVADTTKTVATPVKKTAKKAATPTDTVENALVDYEADVMVNRGDNIIRLVGNVHFHHNGAIIQCDSAFRYDANRMDFFGRVIVEQDSTYIYGDRVNYDGRTAIADVFAPIVKMTRHGVTLFTYNLSFSTRSSIGTFSGGGVVTQVDKLMESESGYYDANVNKVKFLNNVSMRSDSYLIRTDSLSYDMDRAQATFLAKTYIWDHDRDFLMANSGDYFSNTSTYVFTSDAYAMTPDNELWADTMRYVTPLKQAFMQRNVQILDTANSTVAFGDWGFYDDSLGRAVLTDMPSVRSWGEAGDTSYMRSDTMRMISFQAGKSKGAGDEPNWEQDNFSITDSIVTNRIAVDSAVIDSAVIDSAAIQSAAIDSVVTKPTVIDSATIQSVATQSAAIDSVVTKPTVVDSAAIQSAAIDSVAIQSTTIQSVDSLVSDSIAVVPEKERVMRAYHNVRMWAADYQGVCDSMVSFSVDSTAVMYGKPILWSDNSQLTASQIDIYSKNEQMDWADFTGEPFITQQVAPNDTLQYNQANGTRLRAYFKDNEIDYAWLTGNVMNLYYMDEQQDIVAMAVISCAELTILFENREPSRMIWGGAGEGPIYPIEKIPETEERFLKGFSWQDSIRPKNALEICNRIQKPSFRAQAESFAMPEFPISEMMEQRKTEYIKDATWSDRTDVPAVTPEYFLNRSLLF